MRNHILLILLVSTLAACTIPGDPALAPVPAVTPEAEVMPGDDGRTPNLEMQEMSTGSIMILPPGYREGERYPVVFLLPFTGGSATDLFNWNYRAAYSGLMARQKVIVVLLEGLGSAEDYATAAAWTSTIESYEQKIQWDIERWGLRSGFDRERIILAGFSMGGDLAWALSQRQPERYAGAIVMGSRCVYRNPGAPAKLAKQDFHYFIAMGENEEPARKAGAKAAAKLLDSAKVGHRDVNVSGGHVPAPADVFVEAINYVVGENADD